MKTLKKYDFVSATESTYDWDKILDGGIYQLDEGGDFTCKATTFNTLIRNQAAKRGQTVQIGKSEDGKGVVVQATSEPDADKAEVYKQHQAELRAARKAKGEEEGEDTNE